MTKITLRENKNSCTVLYNVYAARLQLCRSLFVMNEFWQVLQLLRRQRKSVVCITEATSKIRDLLTDLAVGNSGGQKLWVFEQSTDVIASAFTIGQTGHTVVNCSHNHNTDVIASAFTIGQTGHTVVNCSHNHNTEQLVRW